MTEFTVILLDIHTGGSNMKISQCLDVKLMTVLKIRKTLRDSSGHYEVMVARNPYSDRSDKKRTCEFLGGILVMIDNDPIKSDP